MQRSLGSVVQGVAGVVGSSGGLRAQRPAAMWVAQRLEGRAPAFTSDRFLALRGAAQAGLGCVVVDFFVEAMTELVRTA